MIRKAYLSATEIDIDLVEKFILCTMFSLFAVRMLHSYMHSGGVMHLLYLINELVLIAFVLFRRRTDQISRRSVDWFLGIAGTTLPLLLMPPTGEPLLPQAVCAFVMFCGFLIHLSAKLILRRSFGIVAANRGVKVSGPYRFVRHPMYTGYLATHVAFFISGPSLVNAIILSFCWTLQIGRMLAEERILKNDPQYQEFMKTTPYRLIPGVF